MVIVKKAAPGISSRALARFTERARRAAGLRGELNVLLASGRDVRALNRRFRGKDKPTDVLSFPPVAAAAHDLAGDIVICVEIAARNARRYGHDPLQEFKILVLHGALHLAGYDHETDSGKMAREEESLRRQLGLTGALIRRSSASSQAVGCRPPTTGRRRRTR